MKSYNKFCVVEIPKIKLDEQGWRGQFVKSRKAKRLKKSMGTNFLLSKSISLSPL